MNKTRAEAEAFARALARAPWSQEAGIERFVIPPFVYLAQVAGLLAQSAVKIGAQNMHWHDHGAWTGEVSPLMLRDCGAHMVELGHSERRSHFNETDETVGLKTAAALHHGLIPLICIGETDEERQAGQTRAVMERQVTGALAQIRDEDRSKRILFAYEPVWAIGEHGKPASPDYAADVHAVIKERVHSLLGREVPCLYGGSVNLNNCAELITKEPIDGLFIGRAAWQIEGYLAILERCRKTIEERKTP